MISAVLIANRGEIAVRIARTARDLGIRSIAIYSEADAGALHTQVADEAYALPGNSAADTYMNVPALLDVAVRELYPGGAAVVALARMGGDLHFAQQRVHLGDREDAAGADRAVAGHRARDRVEPFLERQRTVIGRQIVGEIGDEALYIGLAEHGGNGAY